MVAAEHLGLQAQGKVCKIINLSKIDSLTDTDGQFDGEGLNEVDEAIKSLSDIST